MDSEKRNLLGRADVSRHWENRLSGLSEYVTLIRRFLPCHVGARLLDIGCARGNDVAAFRVGGFDAYGVDICQDFVEQARKRVPSASFQVGSAEQLPYEDTSFDVVFATNLLFYTNIEKSIPEFCRVLRSGGLGVVTFDVEIINLEEGKLFHQDSLEKFERVLGENDAAVVFLGSQESRVDETPFRHCHHYHRIMFLRGGIAK